MLQTTSFKTKKQFGLTKVMIHKKYGHSKSQSAEFLRQTIDYMSRQEASYIPINYALWYEYVSQTNSALNKSIEHCLANHKTLDDDLTSKLYLNHLIAPELRKLQDINSQMDGVLCKVSDSTKEAGEKSRDFSDALTNWYETINSSPSEHGLQHIFKHTEQLRSSIETLMYSLAVRQEEILKLKQELCSVRTDATTDHLTGLLNRHGFEQAMEQLFGNPLVLVENTCLMMVDIDHFKKINDSFGHLFGDEVIRVIAQSIRKNIKGQDIGVRYGGEEFLILLPNTQLLDAQKLAEKMRKIVASHQIKNRITKKTFDKVNISIGISQSKPGDGLSALINRADQSLYYAKESGRNKVMTQKDIDL